MVSEAKRFELAAPAQPVQPVRPMAVTDRLSTMFHDHYDFVWRSVRRLGVAPDAVDDAAQEVFVVASRKLDAIEVGKEKAFLFGTAVRVASDTRRALQRRRQAPSAEQAEPVDAGPALDELVEQKRARQLLDELIEQLPEDTRPVFVLFELEGLTMAEIATCLDLPAGTVASRLRRARELFAAYVARLEARSNQHG
jgi:RNA polymerase sigma-70 factor (ECF subfamily)